MSFKKIKSKVDNAASKLEEAFAALSELRDALEEDGMMSKTSLYNEPGLMPTLRELSETYSQIDNDYDISILVSAHAWRVSSISC